MPKYLPVRQRLTPWLVVFGLLASPWLAAQSLAQSKGQARISLLAINDMHGNILPPSIPVWVADPQNPAGKRLNAGGAAFMATLIGKFQAQNPTGTLVVGAGDLVGATPLASGLFHDEPAVEVLNYLGLNLTSVGNHEFDKGTQELLRLQSGGCFPANADGTAGVVGKDTCMRDGQFAGATFQYLAANVIVKATGKPLFPGYAIREMDGIKVGFIGLTLRDTPSMVIPAGVQSVQFVDEVQTINSLVPELKQQGAAFIVLLIHQGGMTTARFAQDPSCPGFSGDIVGIADKLDPAVALIVSGHTHQEYVCTRPDGRLITQSGYYGRLLTKIDVVVDRQSGAILSKEARNHVVVNDRNNPPDTGDYAPLAADPQLSALVARYGDLSATMADIVVGRIAAPLLRQASPAGESTLGALIADAFLTGASAPQGGHPGAQIALVGPGGIRGDLSSSLSVTFGQLFSVIPFANNLISMDLTGAQIVRVLEQQWEGKTGNGQIMAVSEGFSYTWDASAPSGAAPGQGGRVVPGSLMLDGKPMSMDATYRVVVDTFIAGGGDRFTVFKQGKNRVTGELDSAVLKLYFRMKPVVHVPTLGRVLRIN